MMMREWVYRALYDVIKKKTYSNLYLKDHLQEVDPKDQALASNIFYGTLQNYDLCRYAWSRFARGKVGLAEAVLLTMSSYQLLFLDKVPAYAVINDAVKIAGKIMPAKKGLVNALLRKVSENPMTYPADPIKALALKSSLPEWLIQLWIKQYSPKQAFAFASSTTKALPVIVRANPHKLSPEEAAAIPRLKPVAWPAADGKKTGENPDENSEEAPVLYEYLGSQIGRDPLYRSGKISVQDPGSYEIARWADVKAGQSVLDLCAAPGTKTMAMAEMAGPKAQFMARDLHPHRVELIENDARRLGLSNIQAIAGDSTVVPENPRLYDVVLCDVPCTGYGILARKPDMKQTLNPKDIDSLLPVQKELLEAGAAQTKPGGTLVYSTCTLDKKENEKQVEAFLENHPDFEMEKQQTLEPGAYNGGFYLCKLHRKTEDSAAVSKAFDEETPAAGSASSAHPAKTDGSDNAAQQ